MVIEFLPLATVIPWVAQELFDIYKEKYITPGLKRLISADEDYVIQLKSVINDTIIKYQKKYPPSGNFPFYHHQDTFTALSKHILFKNEEENILKSINFSEIENIDIPTTDQIQHFYNFLMEEIKANDKLKEFYIEENYKERIFDIYKEISLVKNTIEEFIKKIPHSDSLIKDWVNQIYSNLKILKSETALDEINSFEIDVLPVTQISDRNKAFIYFVKGLCLNENKKPDEAMEYFEQACALDSNVLSYRAWNLYLKYLYNNSIEVIHEVKQNLKSNPFDPILNSIVTIEELKKNNVFATSSVPSSIKSNIRYKRIIYRYYLTNNLLSTALMYFESDETDVNVQLENVSVDNYGYLLFYLQLYFIKTLNKYPNDFYFQLNPHLRNSSELSTSITLLTKFIEQIKKSEKIDLINFCEYLLEIATFLKTENKKHLDTALQIYNKSKDNLSSFYINLLRLSFSQVQDFKSAIVLFNQEVASPDEYYFQALLYYQLNDKKNRNYFLIDFIKKVESIDEQNITAVLETILDPELSYKDIALFYDRLLNNSIATDGIYRDILASTKGIKELDFKESSIKILKNNFGKICEESIENISVINAYCRVLVDYELWKGIVDVFNNKKAESYLSKTLLANGLYHTKQQSTKLLTILEELKNPLYPQFAHHYIWQIELNNLLGDWGKVQELSIRGRQIFGKDPAFIYYLFLAYINLMNKEEYYKLIKETDISIFNGLILFEAYSEAIEYIYNYASINKDPKVRMLFYQTFIFYGDRINYQVPLSCEIDSLIKISSPTTTLLITSKEHTDTFAKLIGKRINDTISLSSHITGIEIEYKIE